MSDRDLDKEFQQMLEDDSSEPVRTTWSLSVALGGLVTIVVSVCSIIVIIGLTVKFVTWAF